MEIKTMLQLINKYENDERITADNYAEFYGEKWVSVKDEIKFLQNLIDNFELPENFQFILIKHIKKLKGD